MNTMIETWESLTKQAQSAQQFADGFLVGEHLREAADSVAKAIAEYWADDKTNPECPTWIIKTVLSPDEWLHL